MRPNSSQSIPDESGHELVEERLVQWEEKLSTSVAVVLSTDRERLKTLNKLAKSQIKKGDKTDVVFFGSIYFSGITSDMLILKFDKQEVFARVPFDPGMKTMLPTTNWLFFVRTGALANPVKVNIPGEGAVSTSSATLLYAVGPIR